MEICITMVYLYIRERYGYLIFTKKLTRYFCFHNALINVIFIILLRTNSFIVTQIDKKYLGQNSINAFLK